jgi:hypothetical protein
VHCSRECTPPYLSTGKSNLLQPAQAEVVLGQLYTHLASWGGMPASPAPNPIPCLTQYCTVLYICEYFANFVREQLVHIALGPICGILASKLKEGSNRSAALYFFCILLL